MLLYQYITMSLYHDITMSLCDVCTPWRPMRLSCWAMTAAQRSEGGTGTSLQVTAGMYCTVLYSTVLYITVLYITVLYSILQYCIVPYCTVLYWLYYIYYILYYILYITYTIYTIYIYTIYTILYTIYYSIVQYFTVLYCTVLYCIILTINSNTVLQYYFTLVRSAGAGRPPLSPRGPFQYQYNTVPAGTGTGL